MFKLYDDGEYSYTEDNDEYFKVCNMEYHYAFDNESKPLAITITAKNEHFSFKNMDLDFGYL